MSGVLATAMDAVVSKLDRQVTPQLRATWRPDQMTPPCLFVGLPAILRRTMGAVVLSVPVYLVHEKPGDYTAALWLLETLPAVLDLLGEAAAEPRVLDDATPTGLPAYVINTTLTVRNAP